MTRLLLLRHAESAWNAEQRWQGWADSPLTEAGQADAHECARRLHNEAFAAIVSSDLGRAQATAAILGQSLGLRAGAGTRGLREQDLGAWTGLTKAQIKQRWPERLRERPRRPVGGETVEQLVERVVAALTAIVRDCAAGPILVVTHAGVIRELERKHRCAPTPIPHLEGRWVHITPENSLVLAEPTAGRVAVAAR